MAGSGSRRRAGRRSTTTSASSQAIAGSEITRDVLAQRSLKQAKDQTETANRAKC